MKSYIKKVMPLHLVFLCLSLFSCGNDTSYKIRWEDYDGGLICETRVKPGSLPVFPYDEESTLSWNDWANHCRYVFSGWLPEVTVACEDATYVATFEKKLETFNVSWIDYDDTVLLEEECEFGSVPVYHGETPVREGDGKYSYAFSHWESAGGSEVDEPLCRDRIYYAVYECITNEYKITWEDYNGEVLRVDSLHYGDMPSYGEKPVREADAQYTYAFSNWEPSVERVSGNAVYKAVYKEKVNKYTITWKDYDGTVLKVDSVAYGSVPSYSGRTPSKDPEPYECYVFDGWEPEVTAVVGNAVYTAKYSKQECAEFVIKYDANGGTLYFDESQIKEKGKTLTLKCPTAKREGYSLYGWNNLYSNSVYHSGDKFDLDVNLTMYAMWLPLCPYCNGTGDSTCPECEGNGYFCGYCNEPLDTVNKINYYSTYSVDSRYCSSCGKKVYEDKWNSYSSKVTLDERVMCTHCKGEKYLGSSRKDCEKYVYEAAPTISDISARSLWLVDESDYEYSIDGETYQDSPHFDGLLPHTSYTIYQRKARYGSTPFGIPSKPLTVETPDADVYYVTYELNGGENDRRNPTTYSKATSFTTLYNPTKSGYDFAGWSYNGSVVDGIYGSWNVDITLEAIWTSIE